MKKLLFLLALGLVGCGREVVVTTKSPIYYEGDNGIVSTTDYLLDESYGLKAWAYVVEPSNFGRGHLKYLFSSWWDDSISACNALRSRYEKSRQELDEKIKKTECGK